MATRCDQGVAVIPFRFLEGAINILWIVVDDRAISPAISPPRQSLANGLSASSLRITAMMILQILIEGVCLLNRAGEIEVLPPPQSSR